MPRLPSRNKTLLIAVKNYAKGDIKVFYSFTLLHIFCLSTEEFIVLCSVQMMASKVTKKMFFHNFPENVPDLSNQLLLKTPLDESFWRE